MHISKDTHAVHRSGVALLIVIAMLALFAAVGLAFVFYAEFQADENRFRRMAQIPDPTTQDPEKLLSFALSQIIYDTNNANSKLAGHSLGRSIYGFAGGTIPFNGLGRPDKTAALAGLAPIDGINVPYTYPDLNNPFLAAIDASGNFTARSFYRNGSSLRPTQLPPTNPSDTAEGDVRNIDSLGVVNGLAGKKYFNDAFWIDLGAPFITNRDGSRSKPLFAITILELDSRLNLAVAGNQLADYSTPGTTSRCGLGVFELNPARVLTTDKTEVAKLIKTSTNPMSRLGSDQVPDVNTIAFPPTRPYARVDYTGLSTGNSKPPAAGVNFTMFPTFGAWADAAPQHAAGYDYWNARSGGTANDTALALSNAEALLRWRDRGAPNFTADIFRLLPNNLNAQTAAGVIGPITPYSMSVDTAHLAPFFAGNGTAQYKMAATDSYPKITTVTQTANAGSGDFSTSLQSRVAGDFRRINLNRGFANMQDRVAMAQEIFNRLVAITGATPPSANPPFLPANRTDQQYLATRWLAQFAVNIVDFIDDDESMTTLNWNPKANAGALEAGDFVHGVEINRALINEAFMTVDNDKINDPTVNDAMPNAKNYRINAYAELYNPTSAGATGGGVCTLANGFGARYRLLLSPDSSGISTSPTGMPAKLYYDNYDPNLGVIDWPNGKTTILPGDSSASGNGFYLIGPPDDTYLPDRKPTWSTAVWNSSVGMRSKLFPKDYVDPVSGGLPNKGTLVLQRVADMNSAAQPDPTKPDYNPFVTVDYFADVFVRNSLKYLGTVAQNRGPVGQLPSLGRFQPMQGLSISGNANNKTQFQNPSPPYDPAGNEPKHTFGRQNSKQAGVVATPDSIKTPFDPYYFMDRPLISTAELFNVPTVMPWQVTQIYPATTTCYAACADVNSLLYRFLETVTVGDRMYNKNLAPFNTTGYAGGGKHSILVPGKINLNMVYDPKVIDALFDPQTGAQGASYFTQTDVTNFWNDLQNITQSATAPRAIAGFSDFDYSGGNVTMKNTLFGKDSAGNNILFQKLYANSKLANPTLTDYEFMEGFRKVMNNITFTSNAYAVWITVGYFDVDTTPATWKEVGAGDSTQVRRRMFAIVDRSQLVIPDQQLTTLPGGAAKSAVATTVNVGAAIGTFTPVAAVPKVDFSNWTLKAGMALTIDKGQANEETVTILSINGNTITTGGFQYDHGAGATVHLGGIRGPQVPANNGGNTFVLGNPGPQANFDIRQSPYIVPYFTVID